MLKAKNISKSFIDRSSGKTFELLHDVSLEIKAGEAVALMGGSGSGKSTLAACINGLNPFSYPGECTGSLTVDGVDAPNSSIFELSAHVGTVLQDPDGQFIGLTVAEDMAFALENDCMDQKDMKALVDRVAQLVGVSGVLGHAPYEISGGQKQRVALGGVMVSGVDVLLFDEPLANLDPAAGKKAVELIDEIQKRTGCAVIIIEHRLEDVLHCPVDRVVLMGEGRILFDGDPDSLLCSDLLQKSGIREPLYVTALKYAGVPLDRDQRLSYLPELRLTEADRRRVADWFFAQPEPKGEKAKKELLRAENIDFTYEGGHHALKGISASIAEGEMLSIVGTNGAGKSTFSKVLCGFEIPQKGTLTLSGEDLSAYSIKERADRIGYVMQNPNQMISKTMIFDEVALGLRNADLEETEIRSRVEATLKICGLYPFRNWPISALSFGQKKRVTIASVLVQQPELIILDEPTAGQDFRHYTDIMEFLRGLNAKGVTVVMITHDMHLMLEYTRRALVFCDGRLIADRTAAAVLCDPALVEQAALKETSLYTLANRCGIAPAQEFVERFIEQDREVREGGC